MANCGTVTIRWSPSDHLIQTYGHDILKMSRKKKQKLSSIGRPSRKGDTLNRTPVDIESHLKKAVHYHRSGKLEKAQRIYKKILKASPNHSDCLYLLGLVAHQIGKNDKAIDLINKAIENNPKIAIYYNDLGIALQGEGKLNQAISCFQKALALRPDLAIVYNNMGNAVKELGRLDEAISCYQKALELKPDLAEPCSNMGNAFKEQGKLSEAITCYKKALKLRPDSPETHYSMGHAFQSQGRLNEAILCYQKAQQLKPDHAQAHINMGHAFQSLGKSDEAIDCYRKVLEIESKCAEAYSHLVHELQRTCAWQELEGLTAILDDLTKEALDNGTKTAETPFISLARNDDLSRNFGIARSWSADIARQMSSFNIRFSFEEKKLSKTKISVGYLSNDFRHHATAHLMLSLFGLHNRDKFDIFCYSYGKDDRSYYRTRIQQDCDKFVDIGNLSHADAAKCIYEDRVDILVDLKGYTKGSRLEICALRPAPVQVNYLGFPGTSGADFFDYIMTDRIVTPKDHAPYYSENFAYLPHCYQVNDHAQAISDKDWKRADFELPEGIIVFCSFNHAYKIDSLMFDTWMKILSRVPNSVLWLQWGNKTAERNLKQEAEARGVRPERLIFGEKLPKDEHLARLRLADLALDTRLVNGHTTTSDALWAGVPLITLQGNHFASRVSASILTAIGLPELITYSLEEYEALAVRLVCSPNELRAIRQRLAKNRLTEPLFDTPRFARNLENAYKEMWKIYLAGEKPRKIEVVENQTQ